MISTYLEDFALRGQIWQILILNISHRAQPHKVAFIMHFARSRGLCISEPTFQGKVLSTPKEQGSDISASKHWTQVVFRTSSEQTQWISTLWQLEASRCKKNDFRGCACMFPIENLILRTPIWVVIFEPPQLARPSGSSGQVASDLGPMF